MDDRLTRSYARWTQSDTQGRDEEADAAFGELFQAAVPRPAVSPDFTARTLDAVAAAAARDARRAARLRRVGLPVAAAGLAAGIYFSAGLVASALSVAVVWLLNASISVVVAVATAAQAGPDGWSIISSLGRAAATVIANPAVTVTVLAMQGFAIAALMVLRRLLGAERETFE